MGKTKDPGRCAVIKFKEPLYYLNATGDHTAIYLAELPHPQNDPKYKNAVACGVSRTIKYVDEKGFVMTQDGRLVRMVRNVEEIKPPKVKKEQIKVPNKTQLTARIVALEVLVRALVEQLGGIQDPQPKPAETPKSPMGSSTPVVLRRFGEGPAHTFQSSGYGR